MSNRKLYKVMPEHEYWNIVIHKIDDEIVPYVIEELRKVDSLLYRKIFADGNILTRIIPFRNLNNFIVNKKDVNHEFNQTIVAGVDSSRSPFLRIGTSYFAIVSSSSVIYDNGKKDKILRKIIVDVKRAPEESDPEYALNELRFSMFEQEIKALQQAINFFNEINKSPIILIDGPIVDPPRFKVPGLTEKYNKYVSKRALLIEKIVKRKGIIVGIVKRILGNHLVRSVLNRVLGNIGLKLNDFTLLSMFFNKLITTYYSDKITNDTDVILFTQPLELDEHNTDYGKYREFSYIKIYYSYILLGAFNSKKIPLRMEFAIKEDETHIVDLAWYIVKMLYSLTPPGHKVPIPIYLAHRSCTINKKTSKKLLREMLSKFIHDSLTGMRNPSWSNDLIYSISQEIIE